MDDEVKAGVDNLIRATDYITKNFVDLIRRDSEDYKRWAASRGLCEDKSREAYQKHVEHEQYIRDLREREEELKSELNHLEWEIKTANKKERRSVVMVSLETAIEEINTGKINFDYAEDCCTTEGEVVTYLKRLQQFEELGMEPEEIEQIKKGGKAND